MNLDKLVEMSNRYGKNEEYVLAGGGNTSYKEDGKLFVKSSGTQLSNITSGQFVAMDINKLHGMIVYEYSGDITEKEREAHALASMLAACLPGEESKRPSVEAILHSMFPYKFVLHIHPPLVNGLTCSQKGELACEELFSDNAIWVKLTKPGFILAQTCNRLFNDYLERTGKYPQIVILQNHGIFVAADTVFEIDNLVKNVFDKLNAYVKDKPDFSPVDVSDKKDLIDQITTGLNKLYDNPVVIFCSNNSVLEFVADREAFIPVSRSFTPDHIVNCRDEPLFVSDPSNISKCFNEYVSRKGYKPKIIAVKTLGFFAVGNNQKNAERALSLYLDAIKIATYARSFGGANSLDDEFADFITNWEAEAYRSSK